MKPVLYPTECTNVTNTIPSVIISSIFYLWVASHTILVLFFIPYLMAILYRKLLLNI